MNVCISFILIMFTIFNGEVVFAATLYLKSGKVVEGNIVEKKDDAITIDAGRDVTVTYYSDEIEKIDEPTQGPTPAPSIPVVTKSEEVAAMPTVLKKNAYKITKTFHFHVLAGLATFDFSYPLPRNDVLGQKITDVVVSPGKYKLENDKNGFPVAVFSFWNVQKDQNIDVTMSYVVGIEDNFTAIDPKKVKELSDEERARLAPFLAGDQFTPLNDANFNKIVSAIVEGKEGPYAKAKAIFDYVIDHFRYEDHDNATIAQNPQDIFMDARGNCVDISLLYIQFARTLGIPARMVSGLVFQKDVANATKYVSQKGHTWVEIYLSGYDWVPVDPTFGLEYRDQYFDFPYEAHIREFYGQFYDKDFGSIYRGTMDLRPWPGQNVDSFPVEQEANYTIDMVN